MLSPELKTQLHFEQCNTKQKDHHRSAGGGRNGLTSALIPDNRAPLQHELVNHLSRLHTAGWEWSRVRVLHSSEGWGARRRGGGTEENLLAHCCITIFWSGTGWNSRRHASSNSLRRNGSEKKEMSQLSDGLFWFAAEFKTKRQGKNCNYGKSQVIYYKCASRLCQVNWHTQLAATLFSCIADINIK